MPRKTRNRNIFRATFSGYRSRPGQLAIRIPAAAAVEVVEAKLDHWEARWAESRLPFGPESSPSLETAQFIVANQFDRQETPWGEFTPEGARVMPVVMGQSDGD